MKRHVLLSSGLLISLLLLCFAGGGYTADDRPESAAPQSERSADAVYSIADLAGTWESNGLASGPGAPWWERATITIASDGAFAGNTAESDGGSGLISGTFNISSQGFITLAGSNISDTDILCNVNSAGTVFACTSTWVTGSPGTTEMKVVTKRAVSYSPADLTGTWNFHALASGPGAPFWDRIAIDIGTNGSCSGTENSNDGWSGSLSGTCSLSADGTVTFSFVNPSARCTMDAGKTIIVCTSTWPKGSPGTTDMGIGTKKASFYSQMDLTGTWNFHGLASGPGAPRWDRKAIVIATDGTLTGSSLGSDGSSAAVSGTGSLSADGIVTLSFADPSNRCTMDAGKTVMACTSTGSAGTTFLTVGIRFSPPGNSACDATLTSDLKLHIPVLTFADQYYRAEFQYGPNTLDFTLTNGGVVADLSPYSGCLPASLSPSLNLHMPAVTFSGKSYWLDMTYSQGMTFTVTGAGQN